MTTKTEERVKVLFNEKFEESVQKINENTYTFVLWGILIGIVVSNTNLLGLSAGFIFGYALAKKDIALIDMALVKPYLLLDYRKFIKE